MTWRVVLAIETSCDESAAAVVEAGSAVLSSVVASQAELHAKYGGVFPEMASREHVRALGPVVEEALAEAGLTLREVDAVAVTHGPGLAGSLLVGVNYAKGLAIGAGRPLVGVNHLDGHLFANWLHDDGVIRRVPADAAALPRTPVLNLIVSGGHTELVLLGADGAIEVLGATLDDAAGEAFDKAARAMGLGYPGGPAVEQAARAGDDGAWPLPIARTARPLDFSFSGLKTAVLRAIESEGFTPARVPDLAASFQRAVVDALVARLLAALATHEVAEVHLSGGVSANGLLRARVADAMGDLPVRVPPLALCTDNAAMIGAAATWRGPRGGSEGLALDVDAGLAVGA